MLASPLLDGPGYAADVEAARGMWTPGAADSGKIGRWTFGRRRNGPLRAGRPGVIIPNQRAVRTSRPVLSCPQPGSARPMADPAGEPLITTASDLEELVAHLRACGRFAFDTEFVSEETFEPVLCLVQVATRERLAAIDALALRDLTPFWDVVIDPAVEVVMHAASEDLRICRFQTGKVPRRVFDVQIAAGLVGFGYPLSLGNLMAQTMRVVGRGGRDTDRLAAAAAVGAAAPLRPRRRALSPRPGRSARRPNSPSGAGPPGPRASSRSSWPRSRTGSRKSAGGAFPGCTSSAVAAWRSPAGWPSGASRRRAGRTGRSASSSATTCSWRSPSASRRRAATSRRSATSIDLICSARAARS